MLTLQGNQTFPSMNLCFLVLGTVLMVSVGCKKSEKIRHIIVDADKSGIVIRPSSRPPAQVPTGEPTDRMVVAIHETASHTWTFKISGPISEVSRTQPQWMEFLSGVTFDDEGTPDWQLPEGWKKAEVNPGPFAPFDRLEISDSLNLSVSRLPLNMNLLSNVNRWNGQLSVPPVQIVDLKPIEGDAKVPFRMFDQLGSLSSPGGRMMMPPMGGGHPPMGGNHPPMPKPRTGGAMERVDSPIEYEAPEGWQPGKTSSMVPALSFQIGSGDAVARVTLTRMQGRLNTWDQSSANWAAEVGLDPAEIDLEAASKDFPVDKLPGKMITHISDDDEIEGATIGIRVPRGDDAWFIKMTGPKTLVVESQEDFLEFAKSIRFKAEESDE